MINKPTCGQLLGIVRDELRTTVTTAVADDQAAHAALSMIDQILQGVINRCDHEIAWMHEEIDQITACAGSLIDQGLDAGDRIAEALAVLGTAPAGLHADEVGHRYSLAGEVLSRCTEAASGTPAEARVEAVLVERLEREVLIRGEFQLAAQGMIDPQNAPAQLEAFLSKRTGAEVKVTDFTPILGGYSRLMSRFTATIDGVTRSLIARADPPPGKTMMNTDSATEWALLESLTREGSVPMPDALYYDDTGAELGSRTIILDAVQGQSLLAEIRDSNEPAIDDIVERFVDLCAQIHAVDLDTLPPEVSRPVSWDAYMDTRIQAWRDTEASLIDSDPFFRHMAAWLDTHRPRPAPLSLLHGELQPSNAMVETATGRLLAIDWELARIGDPREDLGWIKWVGTMQPPDLVARDETRFADLYARRSGLGPDLVNPDTIAYFSILAGLNPVYGLATQIDSITRGENTNLTTAYLVSVLSAAHEQWLRTAQALSSRSRCDYERGGY